jgi:glycosyltransferase involved in cell wall biosynthesis
VKVSALIPTYNRKDHVVRAIESVLAQTVPVDEIIVVDDGSTDDTVAVVESRFGDRLKLIRQKNRGVSAARTAASEAAQGEWLAFLDSDDEWMPTKLERQFEALAALGAEFGACFTNCAFSGNRDMQASAFEVARFNMPSKFGALPNPLKHILARDPIMFVQSLLVRRSLIKELNGFDEAMMIAEDTDVLFRLSFKTQFCFVADPLVIVDRTPSRAVGLIELYSQRDDRKYSSLLHLYTKWLAMPELMDAEVRQKIQSDVRSVKYEFAIVRLYQWRFTDAFQKILELKQNGESYAAIFATLVVSAGRLLNRFFRERSAISL